VIDHYGMTETGPATYQCPAEPGVLHVIESAYLPEILQPGTLEPVEPGGTGELVLTTLDRIGSPLLRYRTGDLVRPRAQERCACGTAELALNGGILGRCDDMVIVRGSTSIRARSTNSFAASARWPIPVTADQRGHDRVAVEVEPEAGCGDPPPSRDACNRLCRTRCPYASVRAVMPGSLPRFEMKAA
jgi:phenylacetate-CoA ligase